MSGIVSQIGLLVMTSACLFAWLKGGAAERAGASLIGATWVGSLALQAVTPAGAQEMSLLLVDFVLAFGLLAIAIRYASLWLGAAMVLQGVALALHAEAMGGMTFADRPQYYIALNLCSFGMLAPIIAATAGHWRQTARQGRGAPPPTGAIPSV